MSSQHIKSNKGKRVSKPSEAQKRTNDWMESKLEEKLSRKKQKVDTAVKAQKRAEAIEKTAQACNWKHGFDNLIDMEDQAKVYTTGRKGYDVTKELYIKCRSKQKDSIRYRCLSKGCQQSWTKPQAQRLFNHIRHECRFVDPELLERVLEQAARISVGQKAAKLNGEGSDLDDDSDSGAETPKASTSGTQTTLRAICTKEGIRAQQVNFDLSVINFICVAQIPPRKVDLPEFHTLISKANTTLKPKSSSYIAHGQIPMESCRIRQLALKELRKCHNMTISFDGGTAIRPVSFTKIHVTTPETRIPHLMAGIEASGVSHTGSFYFKELDKASNDVLQAPKYVLTPMLQIIQEIGPLRFSGITCDSTGNTKLARELVHQAYPTIIVLADPCHQLHNTVKDIVKLPYFDECRSNTSTVTRHFSKSSMSSRHFESTRQQMGIKTGLKKNSKIRFAGSYHSSRSMRICLPAVEKTVKSGAIEVKKDHPLFFIKNVSAYSKFATQLYQLEKLTEPIAKAIQCLESGHSNPSDVMVFYLAVVATLRDLADNNDELGLPEEVLEKAVASVCARFRSMILATGQEVYLATFFLHPQYLNSDILRRHNLNPLNRNVIVLPGRHKSQGTPLPPDADIRQAIPSFPKIALYLKQVICRELAAGTIAAAQDYPDTEEGSEAIIEAFKAQVTAYARNESPFRPTSSTTLVDPMKFWKNLLNHPDANLIAPLAMKFFSLVPNSMAEERTVSCITRLNTKDRSCQKVSTLIHMTRIRQYLLRKCEGQKSVKKPVVKFRDLNASLLKQFPPISTPKESNIPAAPNELSEGWSINDIEELEDKLTGEERSKIFEGETNDDDDDDESDEAEPEPIDERAHGFDPSDAYGVDLSSPFLLDLLSDLPRQGAEVKPSTASGALKPSGSVKSTAKKDMSTINQDEW
ncbi:hypothetical protein FRC08_008466 [Ceratobasidium sp. 394]|nr:hypothetical protein FRC08_008466 [Ceratobasidium sp. 394]